MNLFDKKGGITFLQSVLMSFVALLTAGVVVGETFQTDTSIERNRGEKTRNYLLENHDYSDNADEEKAYISHCFTKDNPFKYCLVLLLGKGGWQYVDENLESPYEVLMFDNGPDYSVEGLYRILQNGKIGYADAITGEIIIAPSYQCAYPFNHGQAKVSLSCESVQDGEHTLWLSDEWFYITKPK